ncbi:MAG: AAA family ATPase [Lentisphaeraceae bacterium]|nr:AAA family ATPase [Lentisphaeraceae bacterium]
MKIASITVNSFRCFKDKTTVNLQQLTGLVGSNGSGKTALLLALTRLFSPQVAERSLVPSDFYVPRGGKIDDVEKRKLFIEVKLTFPELEEGDSCDEDSVAECFMQMSVEDPQGKPFCRIRLEAIWEKGNTPDGSIEQEVFWVTSNAEDFSEEDKKRLSAHQRSRIHVHYIPAAREPQKQIKQASGSILYRLFQAIEWSDEIKKSIDETVEGLNKVFHSEDGISEIHQVLENKWQELFKGDTYSNVKLSPMLKDLEKFLSKIEASFSPAGSGGEDSIDRLSDGTKSLFYFTLIGTLFSIEDRALAGELEAIDLDTLDPPNLIIFAIEEPENHLAPHFQGRLIKSLRNFCRSERAQVLLTSHAPAVIKRIEPEEILYLRLKSEDASAEVKEIILPEEKDEAYKFVRGAVKAYPELYFSRLVILGEGDSEAIVIPKIADAFGVDLDSSFVSFVPLGGRHVNHFWRLLETLNIPYITLLDLDLGRKGGGWGRIKYALEQLIANGHDLTKILTSKSGEFLLEKFGEWTILTKEWIEYMKYWLKELEKKNIFFSYPLDLDYSMEKSFSEQYRVLPESATGPVIPEQDDEEKEEKEIKALERVLKNGELLDCHAYKDTDPLHFFWYNYLFLGRGKPVSHLSALENISECEIITDVPVELSLLVKRVKEILSEDNGAS